MACTGNIKSYFACGMHLHGKRFLARQPPLSKPQALLTLIIYFALEISVHQRKKGRPKREGPFYGRIVYPCGEATSTTVTTQEHASHSATCNRHQNRGTVVTSVVYSFFLISTDTWIFCLRCGFSFNRAYALAYVEAGTFELNFLNLWTVYNLKVSVQMHANEVLGGSLQGHVLNCYESKR